MIFNLNKNIRIYNHGTVCKMDTGSIPTCLHNGKTRFVNFAIKLQKSMFLMLKT